MPIRRSLYLVLTGLLVVCGCQASPLSWLGPAPAPTPTVTPTPSPTATFTATPAPSAPPPVGTDTPTLTPTPSPTFTPTPPPTPSVDFKLVSWNLRSKKQGGCGDHNIFITVLDANGAPLSGIIVGDTWNNVEVMTGSPGKEPGKVDIPLYSNTMEMIVKRDASTGQPYTSEVSPPCASWLVNIPDEQMVQAGYCANEIQCKWFRENDDGYCRGHYSWEVVFQKAH